MTFRLAIFGLFLLSGATSLVYEVVWLRKLTLIFGSTQLATTTVLSTFMGGLALGAFLAGRQLDRRSPLKVYGLLEFLIGVYALLVPFLLSSLTPLFRTLWNAGLSESFLAFSLARFAGVALVLLPPTVLMGATLPVLARAITDDTRFIGGHVGALYAVNTFGAVAGTFLAGFVLVPSVGVRGTLWIAAAINGLLGVVAWSLAGRTPVPVSRPVHAREPVTPVVSRQRLPWLLWVIGLSGFGALTLEVAWTRVLALVTGSSVYAFSLMLLAFLFGLASGSACSAGYLRTRRRADPAGLLAALLIVAGLLTYATAWAFRALPRIFAEVYFRAASTGDWLTGAERLSAEQGLILQLLLALAIMFPVTFALGGLFPVVLQLHGRDHPRVGATVGNVYAANTVGTIVGATTAGFLLIPTLGMLHTVTAIAALEVLLGAVVLGVAVTATRRRHLIVLLGVALLCGLAFGLPRWDIRVMNSGVYANLVGGGWTDWEEFAAAIYRDNEPVLFEEGWASTILVADQPRHGNRYLAVNGKVEASTEADLETQLLSAHLPLLSHAKPRDVLVIGLASGISAGAVAAHPVETIRIVEIEPAMRRAAALFTEHNGAVLEDRRVVLSFNDARNELQFSALSYDVIVSEPSNPWMTVAANLFTEEFFETARTRLRAGGVFSQWVQNYSLSTEDLRSIIAAFRRSFRYVDVFETLGGVDLLLIGSQDPLAWNVDELGQRLADPAVLADLSRIDVFDAWDVLQFHRVGPDGVDRLVEGAPRNTDNNARVEFSAPLSLGQDTLEGNREFLARFAADPPLGERIRGADSRD